MELICPKCLETMKEDALSCPRCGWRPADKPPKPSSSPPAPAELLSRAYDGSPEPGMKWYRFLIWFALWASALSALLSGLLEFTGLQYDLFFGEGAAPAVAASFPALRFADLLFGAIHVALAVFAVYTRFRLSGFYKNGPALVSIYYALVPAVNLAWLLLYSLVLKSFPGDLSIGFRIVFSAAVAFYNFGYFQDREQLFIN